MPYIGNTIRAADDYRLIDDISSGFNGSETSFALQVAGSAPVPFPKSPQQVLISVNGVIQEPDPTGSSGFNLVGTNIVFSSAPTNGHAFFGIIYATADYLNAGGNFPAGSLGAPSITFIGDENTGLFRKSGGSVGFVSDATEIANFDSNGITISSGNIIIPDSIIHNGDTNTKIRFPAADTVSVETAGSERLRITSAGLVLVGHDADKSGGDTNALLQLFTPTAAKLLLGRSDTSISSGNFLGIIDFHGTDGTSSQRGARIGAVASGDHGTDDKPTDLVFQTTADGAGSSTERMRIESDGNVRITSQHLRFDTTGKGIIFGIEGGSDRPSIVGNYTSSTNNNIAFNTTGSERMRIDTAGRVLIGHSTGNGYQTLSVSGNTGGASGAGMLFLRRGLDRATIGTNVGADLGEVDFGDLDGNIYASIQGKTDAATGSNDFPGRIILATTADGGSSPSERMRIDSDGDVLVGLTTALSTQTGSIQAAGPIIAKSYINAHTSNAAVLQYISNKAVLRAYGATSGSGILQFNVGGGGNATDFEAMRIMSSGNVGIGTTSPSSPLHVSTNTDGTSDLLTLHADADGTQANNGIASIKFMGNSNHAAFIKGGHTANGDTILTFHTDAHASGINPEERMRITSNGFSKHTSDSGNYVSSTGNYHEFRSNSGNNPNTIFFHNGVGNTQFGIKIQTANEQNDTSHHFIDCREGGSATRRFIVYANGNVQNSNNSYGQLSDIKLKENVVDSNSQWNDIKQLKVRNFNFKNDNTNLKQIGLIAQEAEIVCPSLVFESQDQEEDAETGEIKDKGTTTKSVKYSVLYMKAIKCLQEAMARIEALETKVAALEAA